MFLPKTSLIEAVNAPIWAPMSGTNGSTIFTQDGTDSMTFTREGTPTISTTQQKWGNGSGSFSYNNYIYGTYGGVWSAVWTIEFWFYGSFSSSNGMLSVGKGYDGSGSNGIDFYFNSYRSVDIDAGPAYRFKSNDYVFSANTWNHVAVVKTTAAAVPDVYINGTKLLSGNLYSWTTNTVNYSNNVLAIGKTSGSGFAGYMNDFSYTNTEKYTSNFTPQQLTAEPIAVTANWRNVIDINAPSFYMTRLLGL